MMKEDIYNHFKEDVDLLRYYDPTSMVTTIEEAAEDVYRKIVEHSRDRKCIFVNSEIGYVFYSERLLISFCLNPKFRNKENLILFSEFIKDNVGEHFECFLFNVNTRAINFLKRFGMRVEKSNNLITLLSI